MRAHSVWSRGQAATEYLLLLVIVVAVILGAVNQFNEAFGSFAKNYFGEYFACLLETGEVPSLGGSAARQGLCDASFQAFSLTGGRPPNDPNGSGGNENANKENGSENSSGSSSSADEVGSANATPAGGSASRGRTNAFGRTQDNSRSRGGGRGSGGGGDEEEKSYTGSSDVSTPRSLRASNVSSSNIQLIRRDGYSNSVAEAEREREENRSMKVQLPTSTKRTAADALVKVERKPAQNLNGPEVDMELGFGGYLRILLIVGIILAILLVVGGQLLQASKGSE